MKRYPWVFGLAVFLMAALALAALRGAAEAGHQLGALKEHYENFAGTEPGPPGPPPPVSPRARGARVETLAHADPGGGFNADVVAHRGFAYLGSWGNIAGAGQFCPSQGVRVYDLDDEDEPELVAIFADAGGEPDLLGTWTEKVIVRRVNTPSFRGDLAAVSFQNCLTDPATFRGFGLYDVTNPYHPRRLGLYRAESATRGSHELWLQPVGNRVYVYTAIILSEIRTAPDSTTPGRADFRIVDVTDPTNPTDVSEWGAWKELGILPVFVDANGVVRQNFVHSLVSDGTRAYLSYWDLGTVILDVSDPANPTFLGRTQYGSHEEGNAHSAWVGRGGRLLVQTDEDFSPGPHPTGTLEVSWGYTRLFDIANPASPVQLSTFKLASTPQFPPRVGFFSVHDPKIVGNLTYLSYYAEGVVVMDISRPENPRFVAQFVPEAAPDPRGFFFPGERYANVWGVFVEEEYVLASDINSGLWVFRVFDD